MEVPTIGTPETPVGQAASTQDCNEIATRLFSSKYSEHDASKNEHCDKDTEYPAPAKLEAPVTDDEMGPEEEREPSLAQNSSGESGRLSPVPASPQDEMISAEEQARRDEQASIELARAMMEEEAMASYAASYELSMDYLRHHQSQYSEEDLAALEAAMEEEQAADESEDNAADISAMSYDMLLRLGEQIGDVKTERWEQVAQQKIDALQTNTFDPETVNVNTANDCDIKCLICQCQYEQGQVLRVLPCGHMFHAQSCVDQWLLSKDFCPYCRTCVVEEGA
jgi:hypothetical protein